MMAAPKNRGLGKGLEALFENIEISVGAERTDNSNSKDRVVFIDIHQIKPNANQPRKHFDPEKIQELAASIEKHGIIQPVLVRGAESGYEIVAGERRFRAARKAGLKEIPCIVRELDEEQNMLIALIENMQREDLNAIEEARGISKMIATFGLTQEEVSKSVGKSRPYIANSLRLLKLPDLVQELLIAGRLTGGHGRAIAGIADPKQQETIAERCVRNRWSVREIEDHLRDAGKTLKKQKGRAAAKNREIAAAEEELKEILGTKVGISFRGKKGRIEIDYYSTEELERLLELLKSLK